MADIAGDETGTPVIFLHGGGQTRATWRAALAELGARGFFCVALDQRGHGESDRAPDGDYRLERFTDDLRGVVQALERPGFIVGASLGGLAAVLALGEEPRVMARGLVLVDVVPRIEESGRDHVIGFMRASPEGFASVEEAAAAVAAYLPHREPPKSNEGLKRNLRQGEDGRWRWHWDPRFVDGVLAARPLDQADRLETAARTLDLPTLLVRGELSRVVSAAGLDRFLQIFPGAQAVTVPGADHMVAGDQNDAFLGAIVAFLETVR